MSGFKIGLAQGIKDVIEATEKAALAPHVGGDSEDATAAKGAAIKMLAAHLYFALGHLNSGSMANVQDALDSLREMAAFLKDYKDQG